jgi:hypothetical protein
MKNLKKRRATDIAGRSALIAGSLLVGLVLLELGIRIAHGPQGLVQWPNLVLEARLRRGDDGRMMYDPQLGFVPRPGLSNEGIHYDSHGFRISPSLPGAAPLAEPPILVVGDSFAHGEEVNDGESWAAQLQGLTGRRVVNAAVSAYGLDQMVLRAERVAPEVRPAALVLSFIADDIRRAEMKRTWGAEKPYFELVNGALVLRNVPVPPRRTPAETMTISQRLFGRSLLVDFVLRRLGLQYEWALDHERVMSSRAGEQLLCPLMRRLADLRLPTLVVAEYDSYVWQDPAYAPVVRALSQKVLACATTAGLAALDMFEPMQAAVQQRGVAALYRVAHPGPDGTRIAAQSIAAELKKLPTMAP